MNQAYRVVWNATQGVWQVASERVRARGKTSGKPVVAIGLLLCGVLAPTAAAYAQVSLLIGSGGSGGSAGIVGSSGGSGGLGGGGGGGDGNSGVYGGGGGGGFGGGGGGNFGIYATAPGYVGGNGGGSAGGAGDATGNGGGGDSGGAIGGNGSSGTGGNAGSGAAVGTLTTVTSPDAISTGSSQSNVYSYAGVGGGGGGGGNDGGNGGAGTAGSLLVTGAGVGLKLTSGMLVGGGGGGSGGEGGGSGGAGGAGAVTVDSNATLSATTLQVGGGGGGVGSEGNTGGAGGAGTVTINSGAALSATNLLVGGDGGGGGVATGGNGGAGGTGTVTVTGNSAVNVTGSLVLGGYAGGSGTFGNAGAGGTGIFNLGGGSTLNLTGASFTINGNGTFNLGDATVNDTTAGTITGLSSLVNNGQIDFNQTDTSTISADISGTGSVRQNGSGTTILTGNNTYTGGTAIAAGGTLQIGNGGASGSISGSVTNDGTLAFNRSDNATFGGVISGNGTVQQSGGTLTLSAANTYTGSTSINGGATLALSGAGSVANSSVADSGTLDISNTSGTSIQSLSGSGNVVLGGQTLTLSNANGTFSGVISGTGGLTIDGGTETLTNVNTYTGTTTIGNAATLILSSGSNIALGNVVNYGNLEVSGSICGLSGTGSVSVGTAGLVLTGSGSFGGVISGAGDLTLSGSNETLSGTNTYAGVTTIDRGSALLLSGTGSIAQSSSVTDNGTLDISATAAGATIQNLSGTGSVNLGGQSLTLSNAIGSFSGTFSGSGTLVKQGSGTLILDGNSSSFTGTTEVNAGLLEVGDINTPSALLGGNVSVDAAGTLRGHGTVAGDVINQGVVMPGGSIGTLTIGGNYSQASNAALAIEVSPTQASQLKVGGSAALAGTLAITYDPGTYSAKTYTLVSANSISGQFASVTSTGASNLGALTPSVDYGANAVDLALNATSTPSDPLVIAPTNTSIYTAAGTTAILGAQAQGTALLDRMGQVSPATAAQPYGWIDATGSWTKVGGTNGEPGFQANRYGFLAGLDKRFGASTAGVAIGYDHTDINEQNTGDSGTTDTLRAALYGARDVGPVNLAATLGAGLDFLSQKRPFGAATTAEGDHMGQEFSTGAQASLPMTFGSVTVTPRAGLRYAYFHANGFGESGAGGQDLNVGTDNVHSLQPYAGVTVDKAFGDALKPVDAELRLGYARELLDANRAINVAAQDGTVFVAPGTNLPRGYLTAGASVTLHPLKNLDVSLSYDTVVNTAHVSAQQGNLRVGYQF